MGFFSAVGKITVLLLVGGVLVLGYLGFVPGLSDLMGTNKPRDLGIKPTAADLASFEQKLGTQSAQVPWSGGPANSMKFEGSHPVDITLTSEEFTARHQSLKFKYKPVYDDIQYKFNPDGTVEASGRLKSGNVKPYLLSIGIPEAKIDSLLAKVGPLPPDPSFYLKGSGSVNSNQPNLNAQQLQIGNLAIPVDQIPKSELDLLTKEVIGAVPGVSVDSLSIEGGKAHFKGTYPDKITYPE